MELTVLDRISFQVDLEQFFKKIHVIGKDGYMDKAGKLALVAQEIARPKAMYKTAYIEDKGQDYIVVEGITFHSRVLRVNTEDVYRIFPYVATAGVESEDWSASLSDMLEQYWADVLKEMALRHAIKSFQKHFSLHTYQGRTAAMNPGSLKEWPITEQKQLFHLLGNTHSLIGVKLKESMLMSPIKSVSGILFPSESNYENCQLCSRERCPGRKAPYDQKLYQNKYA